MYVQSSFSYVGQRLLGCQPQQYHHLSRFDMKKVNENEDFEITSGWLCLTFFIIPVRLELPGQ